MLRYVGFCVALMIGFAIVAISTGQPEDWRAAALLVARGAGLAVGPLVFGCIGLIYRPNRFRGFAIVALLASALLVRPYL